MPENHIAGVGNESGGFLYPGGFNMKTSTFMKEEQLIALAIETLFEKLGPVEANRFLTLPQKTRLDSVKRHHLWQAQLDKQTFFDKVFRA